MGLKSVRGVVPKLQELLENVYMNSSSSETGKIYEKKRKFCLMISNISNKQSYDREIGVDFEIIFRKCFDVIQLYLMCMFFKWANFKLVE